ncbi:UPF0496 protein At3g49070 isoform X2 [Cryptomeria japonica]|uniref:UPF0496 protein At3g49070 isoform X2 n=1 Tax=Cryptomeria japonica TaxID=3369 RepID=UPI0027DA5045|nr:UPF0496 protein At3g49070 isoform X2 [Cryptomeria japonica]
MMSSVFKEIRRSLSQLGRKFCRRGSKGNSLKISKKPSFLKISKKSSNQAFMEDFNEEDAMAFRRESYNIFWRKVETLTGRTQGEGNKDSTARSRLPSYRSLAERLLEPEQEAVYQFLQSNLQKNISYNLAKDYFNNTAEAFELCSFLLKNIEQGRSNDHNVQEVMEIAQSSKNLSEDQYNIIIQRFESFVALDNPFRVSATQYFEEIQERYGELQGKLDHTKKLDAAAKGTYILHGDLDTMSRLVKLLNDEIEHSKSIMRICLERMDDKCHAHEVAILLQKSHGYFVQQLDELEEYVFLCFASINRARRLVITKIEKHQAHS